MCMSTCIKDSVMPLQILCILIVANYCVQEIIITKLEKIGVFK